MPGQDLYHLQNGKPQNGQKQQPLQVAVVIIPCPGQSHLNMAIHLSNLISSYQTPVHFIGSSTTHNHNHNDEHEHDTNTIPSTKQLIHFHDFKVPPYRPNNNNNPSTLFVETILHNVTHLRSPLFELLHKLSPNHDRIIVIYDFLMTSVIQDIKTVPNAEAYTFHPISAFTGFFNAYEAIPQSNKPFPLAFQRDQIPPSNEGCLSPELAAFIATQYKIKSSFESGRLYNTSRVIEGQYIELLEKLPSGTNTKHFAIGPFHPMITNSKSEHRCLKWLDKQEKESVIYVSFGTMASLSEDQIKELAIGLENSNQKFIWVLRGEKHGPAVLDGFEERVKGRGIVVRDWAPQMEILAHPSTGGFLSHCGWSSCIESISVGKPIAAWPMNADQPKNSVLVTRVLGIGIMVREWEERDKVVTSSRIENVVRRLMASEEGESVRRKAEEFGKDLRGSLVKGGTSRSEMDSFIAHITRCL